MQGVQRKLAFNKAVDVQIKKQFTEGNAIYGRNNAWSFELQVWDNKKQTWDYFCIAGHNAPGTLENIQEKAAAYFKERGIEL